jgi:signal peptidase II
VHGLPASCGDGALSRNGTTQLRGRVSLLAGIAYTVIVVDQFVKELVVSVLDPGRFVPLLGSSIGWQLVFNPGAAFGLRLPPVVFPIVTLVLIVVVARALETTTSGLVVVSQGLVIGGAVGNVVDRLVRPGDGSRVGGYVVDFVAWGGFPRFNVADACITVGVVLFFLAALLEERTLRSSVERS